MDIRSYNLKNLFSHISSAITIKRDDISHMSVNQLTQYSNVLHERRMGLFNLRLYAIGVFGLGSLTGLVGLPFAPIVLGVGVVCLAGTFVLENRCEKEQNSVWDRKDALLSDRTREYSSSRIESNSLGHSLNEFNPSAATVTKPTATTPMVRAKKSLKR